MGLQRSDNGGKICSQMSTDKTAKTSDLPQAPPSISQHELPFLQGNFTVQTSVIWHKARPRGPLGNSIHAIRREMLMRAIGEKDVLGKEKDGGMDTNSSR